MQLNPYLNFDGQTEAAFLFYARVLGGELSPVMRFGEMAGADAPEEVQQRVMHVRLLLPGGTNTLMGSDTLPGMPRVEGTNVTLSLHPSTRAEADRLFAALADGGTITHPLADQFWGDYYGALTDQFGVQWMVNCAGPTAA